MPRYVLFHTVDASLVASTPGATAASAAVAPQKVDVVPEYVGVDADGNFTFSIPTYDARTHNVLDAIHVSLFEKDASGKATIPADPAVIVASPLSYSVTTDQVTEGKTVVVDATAAPEGKYSAALVAQYGS
jgi:hypothetical protein